MGMSIRKKRSVWEVVDEYFSDLERWTKRLENTYAERPSWNLRDSSIEPLREISVTPTEVLITVDLPFTNKDAVKIKAVGKSSLEITAKMNKTVKSVDLGIVHLKGEFQKYSSYLHVPVPVYMSKMIVKYKKGMLEVHLPRKH
jgi:HSP20 family molecular chaperone IbpA